MKIAVIGATGMIGHHTAAAVQAEGHELFVVHRAGSKLDRIADLRFTGLVGDLDDHASLAAALSQVDAVINCAGYYPTVPRPWREDVAAATRQMQNFYAACSEAPLQKIVYLGAAIALRPNPTGEPGHADLGFATQPANTNPYVQVKWAMDRLALDQAAAGLPVVIGIPSMTFGEHDHGPTTGRLLLEVANGTLPGYTAGRRNVIYAGDAGRGLLRACIDGRPGQRYVFTGADVTMDDLVALMARLAEVSPPKRLPLWLARFAGAVQGLRYRVLGGEPPKISATALAVMSAGQFLDGGKAERELGFRAEVSLEDALARTLRWFRAQGYVKPV